MLRARTRPDAAAVPASSPSSGMSDTNSSSPPFPPPDANDAMALDAPDAMGLSLVMAAPTVGKQQRARGRLALHTRSWLELLVRRVPLLRAQRTVGLFFLRLRRAGCTRGHSIRGGVVLLVLGE